MEGSFGAVIQQFLASPYFEKLGKSTKDGWKRELLLAQQTMGELKVELITRAVIQRYFDALSEKPGKQQLAKTALKRLQSWGIARDLLPRQFMLEIETTESDDGHEPWTEQQIATAIQVASSHISRAISLAVNTGQRGSDLIRMRYADIETKDGRHGISVTQKKTGVRLWVPFSQAFTSEFSAWRKISPLILNDEWNKPFKNRERLTWAWTKEKENNPALTDHKHLVMHGLRASCVLRLRKAGATELEISSMVGMSVQMVTRYCRLADKNDLATRAMDRIDNVRMLVANPLKSNA